MKEPGLSEAPKATRIVVAGTIGALVRERRKAAKMTQAQAAGLASVGTRFLSELERGKETVELDKVLLVLRRLGFELVIAPRGSPILRDADESLNETPVRRSGLAGSTAAVQIPAPFEPRPSVAKKTRAKPRHDSKPTGRRVKRG